VPQHTRIDLDSFPANRATATAGAAPTSSGTNPSQGSVHNVTARPNRSAGPRPRPGSTNATSAGANVKNRNNSSRPISGNPRSRVSSSSANTCVATATSRARPRPAAQEATQPYPPDFRRVLRDPRNNRAARRHHDDRYALGAARATLETALANSEPGHPPVDGDLEPWLPISAKACGAEQKDGLTSGSFNSAMPGSSGLTFRSTLNLGSGEGGGHGLRGTRLRSLRQIWPGKPEDSSCAS
jgi:hypothetical protein